MSVTVRQAVGTEDREACLRLRRVVFVDEQRVPLDEEIDDLDDVCTHFLAEAGGEAVGTARLRLAGGHAKAQRVAVLAAWRGAGVGRALMAALEHEAARHGATEVVLAAQVGAIAFYDRLGYEAWGDEFLDAGIPHRWMRRSL